MKKKISGLSVLLVTLSALFFTTTTSTASGYNNENQGNTTITVRIINRIEEKNEEENLVLNDDKLNQSDSEKKFPRTGELKSRLLTSLIGILIVILAYVVFDKKSNKKTRKIKN